MSLKVEILRANSSMDEVLVFLNQVPALDLSLIDDLSSFLPEITAFGAEIIDYLNSLIQEVIEIIDLLIDGFTALFEELPKLRLLFKLIEFGFSSIHGVSKAAEGLNQTAGETLMDFSALQSVHGQVSEIMDYVKGFFDKVIPDEEQVDDLKTNLEKVKLRLTEITISAGT